MPRNEAAIGHRVLVQLRFEDAERARLLGGIFRPGSRSVMFRFPGAGEHEGGDMFGAVIEAVEEQPNSLLRARLLFWNDLARIYATPGTRFEAWYVRTLGEGIVLPWSLGDTETAAAAGLSE